MRAAARRRLAANRRLATSESWRITGGCLMVIICFCIRSDDIEIINLLMIPAFDTKCPFVNENQPLILNAHLSMKTGNRWFSKCPFVNEYRQPFFFSQWLFDYKINLLMILGFDTKCPFVKEYRQPVVSKCPFVNEYRQPFF